MAAANDRPKRPRGRPRRDLRESLEIAAAVRGAQALQPDGRHKISEREACYKVEPELLARRLLQRLGAVAFSERGRATRAAVRRFDETHLHRLQQIVIDEPRAGGVDPRAMREQGESSPEQQEAIGRAIRRWADEVDLDLNALAGVPPKP